MASLIDDLLTPNRSANFLSEGSFSPGFKIPFFIWSFICWTITSKVDYLFIISKLILLPPIGYLF
jgi:hypothetical protein